MIPQQNQQQQHFSYPTSSTHLFSDTTEEGKTTKKKSGDGHGGNTDETEWKTLVLAFQMYKAAYGDLKVPSRFVVPSMAPWPGKLLFYVCFVVWLASWLVGWLVGWLFFLF